MINKPKFMKDFLRIAQKGDEGSPTSSVIVPLRINTTQKIYLKEKSPRNVILKARQLGTSTVILADFFIDVISIKGLSANVVSYGDAPTQKLLRKVHMFHDLCPEKSLFPAKESGSTHLISFKGMNSTFYIGSSRSAVFGRGDTIHRCHLSEYPSFDKGNPGRAEEIMSEVGQSVPLKTGVLTVESSPLMRGDALFNLYFGAKNKENNFKPFFFPWWLADDYFLTAGYEGCPDEDVEIKLFNAHDRYQDEEAFIINAEIMAKSLFDMDIKITDERIRWRRYKIRELSKKFWREYPEDDQSCWLNPEEMIFSREAIDRLHRRKMPPIDFRVTEQMNVWEHPDGAELYVIGADPAQGLPQGDYSAASVLKVSTGTKVASIRGLFPVDVFAGILANVGREYNNALMAVENNGHGLAVNTWLDNMGYPNMYWRIDDRGKPTNIGWVTSGNQFGTGTRNLLIDEFERAVRSGAYNTYDEQELTEMTEFVMIKGKAQGMQTDDVLFAAMIAWMVRNEANPVSTIMVKSESYLPY